MNVVNIENAKTGEYRNVLAEIIAEGKCPFCAENFNYHKEPVLHKSGDWFITRNSYSYKESREAFLILNTARHLEKWADLRIVDFIMLWALVNWAIKEFKIDGAGFILRFGDPKITGATVKHLHFHLIVPKTENGKTTPVWFPIG